MKGCEVRKDGIIVPGAGANSNNMHSSRLLTSLFKALKPQKKHPTFFFFSNFLYFHTKSYMDPCQFTCLHFQVLAIESVLEKQQVIKMNTVSLTMSHCPPSCR